MNAKYIKHGATHVGFILFIYLFQLKDTQLIFRQLEKKNLYAF